MTHRRRHILAWSLVGLLFFSGWYFVDVAARRSSFCNNCHYMKPYVDQWTRSTHKSVECVQCHPTSRRTMFAQFVKNVTRTYNPRPRAYVPDASCAASGCHLEMPKHKSLHFKTVTFPHQPHLGVDRRGISLHCASCHGASNEAGHVTVDQRICALCHFKGQPVEGTLTWCGSCHGAPTGMSQHGGFVFDMKLYASSGVQCNRCHVAVHEGDGQVPPDKCFSCHVSRVEARSNAKALHAQHVGKSEVRCLECHEPIRHGNIKMLSVLDVSCESCHPNLHAGPKETYLGVGAKGAPATPSRMFAAQINCTGCHTDVLVQGGMSFLSQGNKTANPKACAACHDARYIPMVERWKAQGRALIDEARRISHEGKALAARLPSSSELRALAADLEFNARFLEQGYPVHNIEYAIKVVQASTTILDQLAKSTKAPKPPGIRSDFAKNAFSYCTSSCHAFIPSKEPHSFQGVDFPHTYHVQKAGFPCETCHPENQHKQLSLTKPSDCAACHHTSPKTDCTRCHAPQASLYRGKLPSYVGVSVKADAMAGGVGCADCHDPTKADALKEISKTCETCHPGEGTKNLEAWQKQLQQEREEVQIRAEEARMALNSLERRGVTVAPYKIKLESARARLEYLDKAKGVHNVTASRAVFAKLKQDFSTWLSEISRTTAAPASSGKEGRGSATRSP